MKKEDVLNILSDNSLKAFEVEFGLDENRDILLSECNIDQFIDFCKSIGINIVFFEMYFVEKSDFILDEDEMREKLRELVEEKVREYHFYDSDLDTKIFSKDIDATIKKLHKHNIDIEKVISSLDDTEILCGSIFAIYNGLRVGIELNSGTMDNYPMSLEFGSILAKEMLDTIIPKIEEYEINCKIEEYRYSAGKCKNI